MPVFEYKCSTCGHVTGFLERTGSRRKHPCGQCGSEETEKLFSTFSARSARACPSGARSCSADHCPTGTCSLEPRG